MKYQPCGYFGQEDHCDMERDTSLSYNEKNTRNMLKLIFERQERIHEKI